MEEAQRRAARLERGEVEARDGDQVMAELEAKFQRTRAPWRSDATGSSGYAILMATSTASRPSSSSSIESPSLGSGSIG
jgi:hypothetical protein